MFATLLKQLRTTAGAAALSAAMMVAGATDAREMRVATFEPPQAFFATQIVQAWIDRVNPTLSDGNSFKLYAGALLGPPAAQIDALKSGVADVAFVALAYTPGLFPRSSVAELPFVSPTSHAGTLTLQTLLEEGLLGNEFDDFKVVGFFTPGGYHIITKDAVVKVPTDAAGLKLRSSSPLVSDMIALFGGTGVSLPSPDVYEALERGLVQGAVWNFEAARSFRIYEPANYAVALGMTNAPLALLMSRTSYESLSPENRAAIDAVSERAFAEWAADVIDATDKSQRELLETEGNMTIYTPTEAEMAEWHAALAPIEQRWQEQMDAAGIDGAALLGRAREISAAQQ